MKSYTRVTCKCDTCERTQATDVGELLAGNDKCKMSRLGKPPCGGTITIHSSDMDEAAANAISMLRYIYVHSLGESKLGELTDAVVDDLDSWGEREQSPRDMGWVNDKGLP